jgi:hypothetical protein
MEIDLWKTAKPTTHFAQNFAVEMQMEISQVLSASWRRQTKPGGHSKHPEHP